MLTRFTEPSEIIGAIDIKELREGRYIRRKEGKLPTARLVFLDEIFKSNSAILNILLTIINEKKFYQEGKPEPVPLRVLFAATNEIPEQGELAALKDRFVLKVQSRSVQDEYFTELIDAGLAGRGVQGAEPEAVGRGARDARRLPEGEPLPDATCSPARPATAAARSRTTGSCSSRPRCSASTSGWSRRWSARTRSSSATASW